MGNHEMRDQIAMEKRIDVIMSNHMLKIKIKFLTTWAVLQCRLSSAAWVKLTSRESYSGSHKTK